MCFAKKPRLTNYLIDRQAAFRGVYSCENLLYSLRDNCMFWFFEIFIVRRNVKQCTVVFMMRGTLRVSHNTPLELLMELSDVFKFSLRELSIGNRGLSRTKDTTKVINTFKASP